MKILEIYKKYNLMPILELHQLRVAAVGKIICDSILGFKDTQEVVTTSLLHDMGNIIKFDLNYFPEFLKPKGLEYWEKVKAEYIEKYGPDEHHATQIIIGELMQSQRVIENADQVGFSKLQETAKLESLSKKICVYSDMRVGPYGVVTIEERVIDGRKRYQGRKDRVIATDKFEASALALKEVEKQIFTFSNIKPEDITDELVNKTIEDLKNFEI